MQKKEDEPPPHSHYNKKINSEGIKDLNIRAKITKLSGKKMMYISVTLN